VSVLVAIAAIGITACGAQRSASCAPALGDSGERLIPQGARITVAPGTIVYVALVEPEYLQTHYPRGFPWLAATSSRPNVLARTPLCSEAGAYSLPVSVSAFRATGAGTATLTAKLAPAWRALKTGPRPYQSMLTVRG
jgi:hypothetical protein